MRARWWVVWVRLPLWLAAGAAAGDTAELRSELLRLARGGGWCAVTLESGVTRTVRVDSLVGDTALVREALGPLYELRGTYPLSRIQAVQELGPLRVPVAEALAPPRRSPASALALETVVPGAGYLYIGDRRTGWRLLAMTAAAVATGFATGKEGAAGWVPVLAWTKLAALLQLREEVAALNASAGSLGADRGPNVPGSVAQMRLRF